MMMINLYKLFIFNSATAQWPNCAAYSLHPIALLIIKVKAVNGDHGYDDNDDDDDKDDDDQYVLGV